MANLFGDWLDAYERTARLVPGLLAITPILVLVIAVGIRNNPVIVGLLSLVAAVGLPVAVANIVRDLGYQLQKPMWARWGGRPTTVLLRTAGGTDATKQTRRRNLATAARVELPTVDDERSDPQGSDERYEAAVRVLITKTRERPKFELVFKENQSYGYWRNLLGVRVFGRTTAAASALALALLFLAQRALGISLNLPEVALGEVGILVSLAFWIWVPTEARVQRAAFAYAKRLLDAAAIVQ